LVPSIEILLLFSPISLSFGCWNILFIKLPMSDTTNKDWEAFRTGLTLKWWNHRKEQIANKPFLIEQRKEKAFQEEEAKEAKKYCELHRDKVETELFNGDNFDTLRNGRYPMMSRYCESGYAEVRYRHLIPTCEVWKSIAQEHGFKTRLWYLSTPYSTYSVDEEPDQEILDIWAE
jgi:hypothetical protein